VQDPVGCLIAKSSWYVPSGTFGYVCSLKTAGVDKAEVSLTRKNLVPSKAPPSAPAPAVMELGFSKDQGVIDPASKPGFVMMLFPSTSVGVGDGACVVV